MPILQETPDCHEHPVTYTTGTTSCSAVFTGRLEVIW
jgi:hypothetical protein